MIKLTAPQYRALRVADQWGQVGAGWHDGIRDVTRQTIRALVSRDLLVFATRRDGTRKVRGGWSVATVEYTFKLTDLGRQVVLEQYGNAVITGDQA